ncbi:hypothetical protein HMPREF9098_1735 [Kingella denitrificans ATCC 33394]|uniref:Uncharacterized protein n=1 Tax=Kingella denitrificans ATCC 33394 TaxID=888741 RepID=F0F0V0_9NEIS|nr:hypothetical protein HMPREF9098_1735 [Kingella denitrificans ATCC 33394]
MSAGCFHRFSLLCFEKISVIIARLIWGAESFCVLPVFWSLI